MHKSPIEMENLASDIIGKTLEGARLYAEENDFRVRARTIDGKPMVGTCDFNTNRINVAVINGIVTQAINFG